MLRSTRVFFCRSLFLLHSVTTVITSDRKCYCIQLYHSFNIHENVKLQLYNYILTYIKRMIHSNEKDIAFNYKDRFIRI